MAFEKNRATHIAHGAFHNAESAYQLPVIPRNPWMSADISSMIRRTMKEAEAKRAKRAKTMKLLPFCPFCFPWRS
jgi:hypothetical protein